MSTKFGLLIDFDLLKAATSTNAKPEIVLLRFGRRIALSRWRPRSLNTISGFAFGQKSSFFHTPLAFDAPVTGFPSERRHPVWYGKTGMAWLPEGEKISKISLFILVQLTNVTDGRTDRHRVCDGIYPLMHSIAR